MVVAQSNKKTGKKRRTKLHCLMNCAKGTWQCHVPFAHSWGGRGATASPTQKLGKESSQKDWDEYGQPAPQAEEESA